MTDEIDDAAEAKRSLFILDKINHPSDLFECFECGVRLPDDEAEPHIASHRHERLAATRASRRMFGLRRWDRYTEYPFHRAKTRRRVVRCAGVCLVAAVVVVFVWEQS